jgi:4-oxalocrotonate tautomerase
MPLVEVKLVDEVYSDAEKIELISKVTEAVIAVKGESVRPLTWILIETVPSLRGALAAGNKR